MTCIHICVHPVSRGASSAPEPEPAKWLHLASPPGPRLPRTRSHSTALSGPVISTATSWTAVGPLDMEIRQAFTEAHLLSRRKALIGTLAKLRREHRATCSALTDLQAVTHELLAMGGE